MSRTPTPYSNLRLLLAVEAPSAELWAQLRQAIFQFGTKQADCAGRPLFMFEQPQHALQFCLRWQHTDPSLGLRLALHVDRAQLSENDADWQACGGPRWQLDSPASSVLAQLLRAPGRAVLRVTPAAVELMQRAAIGSGQAGIRWKDGAHFTVAAGVLGPAWRTPVGDASSDDDDSVEPTTSAPTAIDDSPSEVGQPLPDRPHWWLEAGPRIVGPLHGWQIRHGKTRQRGHAWLARNEAGQHELRARLDAQRRLLDAGLGAIVLPASETRLDAMPCFIASHWIGVNQLAETWQRAPIPLPTLCDALARLADGLLDAHALGCAHGALQADDLFVDSDDDERVQLSIDGLREIAADDRDAAIDSDRRALAMLLFRLALGGPDSEPGPFWYHQIESAALRGLLAAALDPADPNPITTMEALAAALAQLGSDMRSDGADTDDGPAHRSRPWWRRWASD
jgi:hypothetical protein